MKTPLVPAVGFYRDANLHWSSQDCLNLLPVRAERPGTRTQYILRGCPGLRPFVRTWTDAPNGPGRGLHNVEGRLFSVVGNQLYQVTAAGVAIPRGIIPGVRRTSMAHNKRGNGYQLSIANGSAGYVFDTSTESLAKVTDDGFPGASINFFVDGYIGYVDPLGRSWGHSDVNNATSYNLLDSYEAEGFPDGIVSALVSHREVLIFGAESIEPYVNSPSGDGTAPFQRASNTVIESGCAAPFSPIKLGDIAVYLNQNRQVCVLNGYTEAVISHAGIHAALLECTPEEIAQSWAFGWSDNGVQVYYLTVPGRFTFGFDFTNKEWHRRATSGLPHWAVSDVAKWNGQWIAQDSRNGDLCVLDWSYPYDITEELIREYSTAALHANGNWQQVHEVNLLVGARLGGAVAEVPTGSFPAQPNFPSITGSAPDGIVGVPYPGAGYTAVAGDSPTGPVALYDGEMPPGLVWLTSDESISTGIPSAAGTYPFTLRTVDNAGLPGVLNESVTIANTPGFAGTWFLTISGTQYLKSSDITTLLSATPENIPGGIGPLSRISCANWVLFLHGGSGTAVSFDGGATFATASAVLSGDQDVYWNGSHYYCKELRSNDGLSWEALPNISGTLGFSLARKSDGLVVIERVNSPYQYCVSTDNCQTWVEHPTDNFNFALMATNGARIWTTASSTLGRRTDDAFETSSPFTANTCYTPYCGKDGVVMVKTFPNGAFRSVDGETAGATYSFDAGSHAEPTICAGFSSGEWAYVHMPSSGTMELFFSNNSASSFLSLGTRAYSSIKNILCLRDTP